MNVQTFSGFVLTYLENERGGYVTMGHAKTKRSIEFSRLEMKACLQSMLNPEDISL